jgi:hypothetical protein
MVVTVHNAVQESDMNALGSYLFHGVVNQPKNNQYYADNHLIRNRKLNKYRRMNTG